MSDAQRQFSRWGGGSAGMDRRSFPERGDSTAQTPERKGQGAALPDPQPCWLGLPEPGASTAETPERKGPGAGHPDP